MLSIKFFCKCGFGFLVFFITGNLHAQQLNMDVRDFNGNIQIFDPANPSSKNNLKQSYADVDGSPFWDDKWNPAIVYFNNGTKAKINQARLNLYTDEIHYINSVGTELAIENQGITRLVFLNKNNLTQPIASFAKLVNHVSGNGTAFYKVLNAGAFQLILLQKQFVKTSPYDPIQGKSISSFYTKKNYAIYNVGNIIALDDLNKKSMLAALGNDTSFDTLVKENKSKLKSEKEITDLLEAFNLTIEKSKP